MNASNDNPFPSPDELAALHHEAAAGEIGRLRDQVRRAFREPRMVYEVNVDGFGQLAIEQVIAELSASGWRAEPKTSYGQNQQIWHLLIINR